MGYGKGENYSILKSLEYWHASEAAENMLLCAHKVPIIDVSLCTIRIINVQGKLFGKICLVKFHLK
ncbi:hypothetical protein NQ317_006090 [Molorchus minor]|uniref:Uncharacterized protein n=1 Tax=Molorchus minor TaxID=1323400 RepID=A0ABQ9ISQ2_9CUCU|nr:hypothetical protein NQ317_006090 [Molorchus minor]